MSDKSDLAKKIIGFSRGSIRVELVKMIGGKALVRTDDPIDRGTKLVVEIDQIIIAGINALEITGDAMVALA